MSSAVKCKVCVRYLGSSLLDLMLQDSLQGVSSGHHSPKDNLDPPWATVVCAAL